MCRFWLFKYILWSQWFAFELALLQVSEGYEQKTPMVQSHQTSAWERWLFRDKFDGGLLKTFSKRRHTENFNRPLGISVRGIRSLRKCVTSQTVSSQTSSVDSQTCHFANCQFANKRESRYF